MSCSLHDSNDCLQRALNPCAVQCRRRCSPLSSHHFVANQLKLKLAPQLQPRKHPGWKGFVFEAAGCKRGNGCSSASIHATKEPGNLNSSLPTISEAPVQSVPGMVIYTMDFFFLAPRPW